MNIYELENWMNKNYSDNLFRRDIVDMMFDNLLHKLREKDIKIKNEEQFYKDFLIYLIKFSN